MAYDGDRRAARRKAGTTTVLTTSEPRYTFTGLTSTSKYYVTVRAIADQSNSKWSRQVEVKLDQTAIEAPLATGSSQQFAMPWYTLQGQRVQKPTRGIYVHNGRKVLVK